MSLVTEQSFPRHAHDQFGIGIFTQGAQRSWSHLGKIEAAAGNIIMVNPGEMHDGIPLNGPRSWQMIYLDPERVAAEFQGAIKAEDILLRPVVEDPQLRGLMQRLFSEIVTSAPEDTAVEEALLLCLMRVSRYHLCARRPDKRGTPSIALARQYLDDAPEEKISLEVLATLCGLSRFQLIRGFARETGITPMEFYPRRYRLHGRLCRSKPSDPRVSKAVRHDPRQLSGEPLADVVQFCSIPARGFAKYSGPRFSATGMTSWRSSPLSFF